MKYRADIDGLRAIAVILVLCDHLEWSIFTSGYIGVDVFFVISGYLITGLCLRELQATLEVRRAGHGGNREHGKHISRDSDSSSDGENRDRKDVAARFRAENRDVKDIIRLKKRQFSFSRFYLRRIKRILPALLFMLTVVTFSCLFLLRWNDLLDCLQSVATTNLFVANLQWSTSARMLNTSGGLSEYSYHKGIFQLRADISTSSYHSTTSSDTRSVDSTVAGTSVDSTVEQPSWLFSDVVRPLLRQTVTTEETVLKIFYAGDEDFEPDDAARSYFGTSVELRPLLHMWSGIFSFFGDD